MKLSAYVIATDGVLTDDAVKLNLTVSLGDLVLVDKEFAETGEDLAPAIAAVMHSALTVSADYESFDDKKADGIIFCTTELPPVALSVVSNNAVPNINILTSVVDISVLESVERISLMKRYLNWAIPTDRAVVDVRMMNKTMPGER